MLHKILLQEIVMKLSEEYSSKDLDHLGLVAGMCRKLGLAQIIDTIIPPDPRVKITTGECVELMVINGLGFTSRPQYLEAQFFSSKPVSRLIGRSLDAEEITDDRLARALDKLYHGGCEGIFSAITSRAVTRFNVDDRFRHLDTTSMHVHGDYEEGLGLIAFGYSKDGRPDLKQFMISLMSSSDGDVPLLAKTISGNSSDKKHFREVLQGLQKELKASDQSAYYVADSALYSKQTLEELSEQTLWITRVPSQIKAVQQAYYCSDYETMEDMDDGYRCIELGTKYGGVRQRWLLVHSEKAYARELKTLDRRIAKELNTASKALKKLKAREFSCSKDAQAAAQRFEKQLKFHGLKDLSINISNRTGRRGRPATGAQKQEVYQVKAQLTIDATSKTEAQRLLGMFIIGTNELDEAKLSKADMLHNYKQQQSVERGFRFLKDPLFLCSSVFLKKEERIVALTMVMCLCLLIYMLTQRLIRQKLSKKNQTLPNQLGKPTDRPTMRWIYQVFEGIHVVYHRTRKKLNIIITNIRTFHTQVIHLLGGEFEKIYS